MVMQGSLPTVYTALWLEVYEHGWVRVARVAWNPNRYIGPQMLFQSLVQHLGNLEGVRFVNDKGVVIYAYQAYP